MNSFCQTLSVITVYVLTEVTAEICNGYGHRCEYPKKCCQDTCCMEDSYYQSHHMYRWSFWNMWYFWFIVIFILMSCFGGCGYWRRRQWLLANSQQTAVSHPTTYATHHMTSRQSTHPVAVPYFPGLTGQQPVYPVNDAIPTQGNFPSPPAYSEVISKPDTYPVNKHDQDLPPYPGYAANSGINQAYQPGIVNSAVMVDSSSLRGLPPYSGPDMPPVTSDNSANTTLPSLVQASRTLPDDRDASQQPPTQTENTPAYNPSSSG